MKDNSEKYFNWADIPKKYKWVGVNKNGDVWAYHLKPIVFCTTWVNPKLGQTLLIAELKKSQPEFMNLLFKRPTTEKP